MSNDTPVWSIYGLPDPTQAGTQGTSAGQSNFQPSLAGSSLTPPPQGGGYDKMASKINDISAAMGGTSSALPSSGDLIGKLLSIL